MTFDLDTPDGLAAGLAAARNSWSELSRRSGIPESTLRGRAKRLGVERLRATELVAVRGTDAPALLPDLVARLGERQKTEELVAGAAADRRGRLDDALAGNAADLTAAEFNLFVEMDAVLEQEDHLRLLRAASLAIQGWPQRFLDGTQHQYLQRVAAACRVDAKSLDAYVLVLQNEIKYRQKEGAPPRATLPILIASDPGGPQTQAVE